MRKYKKLAVAMPLAGMIMSGVGVLGGPASTFADTTPQDNKLSLRYMNLASTDHYKKFFNLLNKMNSEGELGMEMVAMPDNNPKNINISEAHPDDSPENTTEVASYHNTTDIQQSLKTSSKKITYKNTLAIKNNGSISTNIESKTTFEVQVPFFAKGAEELKVGLNITYNREHTDTEENTQEFTVPEQTLLAAPHGTTKLVYNVQSTKFSGTYNTKVIFKITANKKDKEKQEEEGYYYLKGLMKYMDDPFGGGDGSRAEFADLVQFDDVNKKAYIKDAEFTFEGKAGHESKAEAVFTPDDKTKPEVKMPIAEYNKRVANGISLYAK